MPLCSVCNSIPFDFFREQNAIWSVELHHSYKHLEDSIKISGCAFCEFLYQHLEAAEFPCPVRLLGDTSPLTLQRRAEEVVCMVFEAEVQNIAGRKSTEIRLAFDAGWSKFPQRPVSGDLESQGALKQTEDWLSTCDTRHDACTVKHPVDRNFVPKFLIDVQGLDKTNKPRLVMTEEINVEDPQYLALAYHFEDEPLSIGMTTLANLSNYMESIPTDQLPAAFKDAVKITMRLGLRYLWIKSLCVIDDSSHNHHTQFAAYSNIFASAYCTIAAAASSKSNKGCYQKSKQILPATVILSELKDNDSNRAPNVTIFMAQPHIQEILDELCPLYIFTDSMVAQHISPRILHFTPKQILWQCQTTDAAESLPGGERKARPDYTTPDGQLVREIISTNCRPRLHDLLSRTTSPTPRFIHNTWHRIVEEYTMRNVSHTEKTFTDIYGLAQAVQPFLRDEYVAGLWSGDLIRSLLWRPKSLVHKKGYGIDNKDACFPHRADSYVAPSWSWASQTYPVDYSLISGEYGVVAAAPPASLSDEVARVTGVQLVRAGTEPIDMQNLHSGELKLVGKLRKILACPGPGWPDTKYKPFKLRQASGELLGSVVFDDPCEIGDDELWLECLWCYPRELKFMDQGRWHGFGLALLKTEEKEKTYRRVGYFDQVPLDYWKDSDRVEITII